MITHSFLRTIHVCGHCHRLRPARTMVEGPRDEAAVPSLWAHGHVESRLG